MSDQEILESLAKLTNEQLEIIAHMIEELNAHYSQEKHRNSIRLNLVSLAAA